MLSLSSIITGAFFVGLSSLGAHAATCTHPSVRREWRKLSVVERAEWISAINCLANLPHDDSLTPTVDPSVSNIPSVNTSGSYWDDLVYIHMDLNTKIHSTGLFLPFHRFYVQSIETSMKERCGYTGAFPYWNWSIDAHDVQNSPLFKESDPISGLGGWGDPAKDIQVQDGGFRHLQLAYPVPHILRRNFTLQPFLPLGGIPTFTNLSLYANETITPEEVHKLVTWTPGDFVGFQFYMERPQGPHTSVHFVLGGDLSGYCPSNSPTPCIVQPTFSANEPMFFFHHAMVDKIWYDWQRANSANFWAYKGGSVQNITSVQALHDWPNGMAPDLSLNSTIPADGMFPEVTIGDVMNTTGGYLCYVYE
ncbi:Di-copper centre-containing protein [Lentinus tigrinus ALCF2SS1-7]|uniref:Di-copper centre-containing protein n=1 Tax=Lentinus tigrinus ALCF2SS1-7 TaxID=1328758 RepID=UPI0011660223|nr:Di-copper centre-containing protein [Lentinus tigrinus ALCF2SS1-7]